MVLPGEDLRSARPSQRRTTAFAAVRTAATPWYEDRCAGTHHEAAVTAFPLEG